MIKPGTMCIIDVANHPDQFIWAFHGMVCVVEKALPENMYQLRRPCPKVQVNTNLECEVTHAPGEHLRPIDPDRETMPAPPVGQPLDEVTA